MADRVRTTVAIDPEVLATFKVMADSAGMSLSRCIGDWLADTAEGARMVATKMAEARATPRVVMRELQAASRGLVDEIDKLAEASRQVAKNRAEGTAGARRPPAAPSSNTGLKSPRTGKRGSP